MAKTGKVKVWHLFVRAGHWAIVAPFAAAYVTGGAGSWIRGRAGDASAAMVAARANFGFVGLEHARFKACVDGRARVGHISAGPSPDRRGAMSSTAPPGARWRSSCSSCSR